jgi:hypothetical protein
VTRKNQISGMLLPTGGSPPWTEKVLDQFLLLLEASKATNGLKDIGIDRLDRGEDVSLDHLHHGQFEFEFTLTPSCHPRVLVDLGQLKTRVSWGVRTRKNLQ